MSTFGVILVCIFPHSDQNNSEYGHLLTSIVRASNHTKCMLLSNQKCMAQPTVINLHPNEYSEELHYYQFAVKLDKFVGCYNTFNDLSNKECVPNKIEDLYLNVFNMITVIMRM